MHPWPFCSLPLSFQAFQAALVVAICRLGLDPFFAHGRWSDVTSQTWKMASLLCLVLSSRRRQWADLNLSVVGRSKCFLKVLKVVNQKKQSKCWVGAQLFESLDIRYKGFFVWIILNNTCSINLNDRGCRWRHESPPTQDSLPKWNGFSFGATGIGNAVHFESGSTRSLNVDKKVKTVEEFNPGRWIWFQIWCLSIWFLLISVPKAAKSQVCRRRHENGDVSMRVEA